LRINGFGKTTEDNITEFEGIIGFRLPNDYREFLLNYNGGIPQIRNSTFWVESLKENIPLDVLLGLDVNKLDLFERNAEYKTDLLPNCIIIGDDPGSGMIVLMQSVEIQGIYYWDHSYFFSQSSANSNVYRIADNFTQFINMLTYPK